MFQFTHLVAQVLPHRLERKLRNIRDKYFRNYSIETLPKDIYDEDLKSLKISFCITCMNRFYHLKHTILKNIEDNKGYPNVEFVLVKYNSSDGLDDWVRSNLKEYIDSGILVYYHTYDPKHFHASKAKNLAHKLSSGDIVCNLDGDNFTGKDFAYYINYLYNKFGEDYIFHFKKPPYWGTEGRIVLTRMYFDILGGYDESFYPTGHQDHDLIQRGIAYGMHYENIKIENFLKYLSNSTKEKSSNLDSDDGYYYKYRDLNREQSEENIKNGNLIANANGMSPVTVYKNFSTTPIPIE